MSGPVSTPAHCPGFQNFKTLSAITCICPSCGEENEIFSDEFDKEHKCTGCGKKIDFTRCKVEAQGKSTSPR